MRTHLAIALIALASCGTITKSPSDSARAQPASTRATRPPRIGIQHWLRGSAQEEEVLHPLIYANHLPKSFAFETLLRADDRGVLGPGLAESWSASTDRTTWTLRLRPGARFHDGRPCDAQAVADYFAGWLVGDQDRFIGACERIRSVRALDARTVEFRLSEGYPLDLDLPLANPMAIVGNGSGRSESGLADRTGTGRWTFAEQEPNQRVLYRRAATYDGPAARSEAFEYVIYYSGADRDPRAAVALQRGAIDALVESWRPSIPRDALRGLERSGHEVLSTHGSMVQILCFETERGPFRELASRARLAASLDRNRLVEAGEHGYAEPVETLFAPWLEDWPDTRVEPAPIASPAVERTRATLLLLETDAAQVRLGIEIARQASAAGIDLELALASAAERNRRIASGEYDVYVHRTWGAPYDPHATLYDRLGLRVAERRAEAAGGRSPAFAESAEVQALVEASWRAPDLAGRRAAYREIQAWVDRNVAVVPLFVPRRIAVVSPRLRGIRLGDDVYRLDLDELESIEEPTPAHPRG